MDNATADIVARLKEQRIHLDETHVPEGIHFDLASLEALQISEDRHFWTVVRQFLVTKLIGKFGHSPTRFLDVGCGNGSLLKHVKRVIPDATVAGMDGYAQALLNSRHRNPDAELYLQDISRSGWMDTGQRFNAVTYMDVLEHLDHPEVALQETAKILTDDGILMISVPGRHELWSTRDQFLGHRRRYDHRDLSSLLVTSGFVPIHINYLFSFLYVPIVLSRRVIAKVLRIQDDNVERHELSIIPIVNDLMMLVGKAEVLASLHAPIPFGSTVYCVARKKC